MNMVAKSKHIAPVRIDDPASIEALRMVSEWCEDMRMRRDAMAPSPGGELNMLEVVRQLHLAENSGAKRRGRGEVARREYIGVGSPDTARGSQSRSSAHYDIEELPDIELPEPSDSVRETDLFMSHLRRLDEPSYFVLVSWGNGRTVVEIAKAAHWSPNTVYTNLKAGLLAMTSHIKLRTFA